MSTVPLLRPALPADVSRLAELATQLGYPSAPEAVAARLRAVLAQPGNVVLVAEVDGRVLGWAHAFIKPSLLVEAEVELEGLVVDEAARGRGLGRALIGAVEAWARAGQCRTVYLRSGSARADAHRFYEDLGFTLIKTQKAYRKQLS